MPMSIPWDRQRSMAQDHLRRLRAGCEVCMSHTGRAICPSCFTHITCGTGCAECQPYRRNYPGPSHKPTEPRGGN